MYSAAREHVIERYAAYLSAPAEHNSFLLSIVCSKALSDQAKTALSNSAEALGYGSNGCFFITLDDGEALSDAQLFELIEGIDPLALVVADKDAAQALTHAYRDAQGPWTPLFDKAQLIWGRDGLVFTSFESMLKTPESKQRAWSLLKKLPALKK